MRYPRRSYGVVVDFVVVAVDFVAAEVVVMMAAAAFFAVVDAGVGFVGGNIVVRVDISAG